MTSQIRKPLKWWDYHPYEYLRDVCSQHVAQNPIQIGGPGHNVEIDEPLVAKCKYNVGHMVPEQWVFGGKDVTTGNGFLVMIPDRTQNTLLPIIETYILPGTTITSDGWRSYQAIPAIPIIPPYVHHTVNHTQNFVDPNTGATTNHVERWWKEAKQKFKRMNGIPRESLQS